MDLSDDKILFLAVATAIVIAVIIYIKYYQNDGTQCYEYDPDVMILGANDSQQPPLSFEYYKSLETNYDINLNLHPSLMSLEQLEEQVSLSGLCMGPGLVEGNRFRGNLNL